jgi:hypothetical protein
LAIEAVPPLFFLAMLVLYVTVLERLYRGIKWPLVLFLVVVILWTGYDAMKRVRDLRSGVAMIDEDILQRIGRTRRARGRRYAIFARLGRMWIRGGNVARSRPGHPHRVTYSPVSRIVWSLDPH